MESFVTLWLWLAIPATLPGVGEPCPVYAEELALFPPYSVVVRERDAAWMRYQYTRQRRADAELYCRPDLDHWRLLESRARHTWDVWGDLCVCYDSDTGEPDRMEWWITEKLKVVRRKIGYAAYYSGLLPPHVDVWAEPVEVVPLP